MYNTKIGIRKEYNSIILCNFAFNMDIVTLGLYIGIASGIITILGVIFNIFRRLIHRINHKNDSHVRGSNKKMEYYVEKQSLHADIKCRYYKDFEKKSFLIFSNEGNCAANNIKIEGLDAFYMPPAGSIPPVLDPLEEFRLMLYLITSENNSIINLSVSWEDSTHNRNYKKIYVSLS